MNKQVELVFWDVQHGHSTYIKSPNNRHIVIDLGTGDYSGKNEKFSPLLHLKNNYNVKQLDYVIITHPHLDHIDDILNFDTMNPKMLMRASQLTNKEVMEGVQEKDKKKFEKYCEINTRFSEPVNEDSAENLSKLDNWGGLKILSFNPTSCNHNNYNNHSIITVIEFADIKIVIPGDNEKCSFEELFKLQTFKTAIKDADILLAPHHGRESGYNLDFINLVNPRLTVVSDGRFCDTSANAKYTAKSRGWLVHSKNGTSKERKCLTTNTDGEVYIKFGYHEENKRFLEVRI
ncbi:MBL fold metallo-hydrolase [Flavobacterium psychrophilum]|nr:MBL fold metallo-hydrolase [Flavobacterium psychrophilum]